MEWPAAGATAESEVVYNGTDPEFFAPNHNDSRAHNDPDCREFAGGQGARTCFAGSRQIEAVASRFAMRNYWRRRDRDRFARLARDLGISGRVHLLGRRSRAEVAEAMRNCTVFVLPSRYEGLGCVYLEAMACGKPAIGCHGQGIEEIIRHGENGWLIPIDGLEDLVQGLKVLLGNADLRARIGNAARLTILDNLTLSHQAGKVDENIRGSGEMSMDVPAAEQRPQRADLIALSEKDLGEIAQFIAKQSRRPRETVEAHLRWFLLENPARGKNDPLGFGLVVADQLAGCILCVPQFFHIRVRENPADGLQFVLRG